MKMPGAGGSNPPEIKSAGGRIGSCQISVKIAAGVDGQDIHFLLENPGYLTS